MLNRVLRLFLVLFVGLSPAMAQDSTKVYHAARVNESPKIDGELNDAIWNNAEVITDFFQYLPNEGAKPTHPTEVRIVYDDRAIYIGALMIDSAPDSVLGEMGARDAEDLNADFLRIGIDPYYKHQDAYFFGVYASGVQFDNKVTDPTFDAVWESSVMMTRQGWVAEIKIPYSAFRFPKVTDQKWSFQINRSIRRNREFCQWSKTPSATNNPQLYWGTLTGISNIKLPLRLSFTPYLSAYVENAPVYNSEGEASYANSFSYNAGADVKYGINESFTVDMTLLPDFGQVQSDNKVKNLSYREVTYDENRPFFKESVELFNKNRLFYSRRIGDLPSGYYGAGSQLNEGEVLTENPSKAKLLHALKLSGRTEHGLGIGFFNAVTDNTYAVAEDSLGNERKILTEPRTNYNAIVFEQDLKNNSEVYFINTNVIRDKKQDDANVSAAGFTISNKKNTFSFVGTGGVSQQFSVVEGAPANTFNNTLGYSYSAAANKLGGTFNYGGAVTVYDNNYYTSDLGYQTINSRVIYEFYLNHNLYKPWKHLRNSYNGLYYNYASHYSTQKPVNNDINLSLFGTFLNYFSVYGGGGFTTGDYYDYFEPRVEGRVQKGLKYFYSYAGISSDYRKKLAIDFSLNLSNFTEHYVSEGGNIDFKIRYRFSDKFNLKLSSGYSYDPYNLGFVDIDANNEIIYGLRIMNTYVNQLTATYTFKNDMFLSLNARHYWSTANYRKYLTLLENGDLEDNYVYDLNNNFNYNAFNIDLVYSWQFAPGSNLSIVYKNAIENDEFAITTFPDYGTNLKKVIHDPQTNGISVKVLYYLDYQYLKRKR